MEAFSKAVGINLNKLELAWILSKGDKIVPIPGTRRIGNLLENISAAEIYLSNKDIEEIEAVFPIGHIQGERYTEAGMVNINL